MQVYVVGGFSVQLKLQTGYNTSTLPATLPSDVLGYLAAFNTSSGLTLWTRQFGGQSTQVTAPHPFI